MEGEVLPALSPATSSMIALKCKHLIYFLQVAPSDDSLDQSPTMTRQSTRKLGLADFDDDDDDDARPYMLATHWNI